ncbi:subtype II CRISPR-associated endonuclease Cas1, partial [Gardnerella vaginalis]
MQNAWRVIDCTNLQGELRYIRGRILVCDHALEQKVEIPLAETAILLIGLHCNCSTGLLHQCAEYGTCVMTCDWRCVPISAMHSWTNVPTRITVRQLSQATMSVPRRKAAWAQIVRAKIRGQAACLDLLNKEGGGLLRGLSNTVRSGDVTNREGQAAREYWKRIFPEEEDFHRKPGSGQDRNALLDYAYMVLRGFSIRAVLSAGLNPTMGMNHHNGTNYFCLADDIIEPFRPAVDYAVSKLSFSDTPNDKAVKKYLIDSVNQQFNGSGHTIPS